MTDRAGAAATIPTANANADANANANANVAGAGAGSGVPARAPVLDPDAAHLLVLSRKAGYPPFERLTPTAARAAYAASWAPMQSPGGEVASVLDRPIAGPGGDLPLRIYRGLGTEPQAALPCLVFLHGGGWVIGGLDSHDRMCRRLATVARICVVAVDYRLAPEHPFPAALDDAAAAWRWVHAQAGQLGIDPQAIGIGGDSAGGNLAAVLALMGRDGDLPASRFQALFYPVLDLCADSGSYRKAAPDLPLTAATMRYFIDHYTPRATDRLDWRASPLRAASLAGAPPALVLSVAHDPLCDEARAYAQRLDQDGVRVLALHCNDQMHGLLGMGRLVPAADVIADHAYAIIGFELYRRSGPLPAQVRAAAAHGAGAG